MSSGDDLTPRDLVLLNHQTVIRATSQLLRRRIEHGDVIDPVRLQATLMVIEDHARRAAEAILALYTRPDDAPSNGTAEQ